MNMKPEFSYRIVSERHGYSMKVEKYLVSNISHFLFSPVRQKAATLLRQISLRAILIYFHKKGSVAQQLLVSSMQISGKRNILSLVCKQRRLALPIRALPMSPELFLP